MKSQDEIVKALNSIRETVDADVIDLDIDMVRNKLLKLTQLTGLSAEAQASAKKLLSQKELEVMLSLDKNMAPSKAHKMLSAMCFEQQAVFEYADRLNSAIVHSIDGLRSILSLYKSELENSLKQ